MPTTGVIPAQDAANSSLVPSCAANETALVPSTRLRIAVISHFSIVSTFFLNPETAAREAASLLNIELEWDRHVVSSTEKMSRDIKSAVERGVNGMIVSIPSDEVFQAVKDAKQQSNIPIIVFNTGLEYAKRLGLTRVLQSDEKSADMMAQELQKRNYSNPLAVQIIGSGHLDDTAFDARLNWISHALGRTVDVLPVYNIDDAVREVRDAFIAGPYDSIVSLGGLAGIDLVTTAASQALDVYPYRQIGVSFYDIGSKSNMTDIFNRFPDAFGISQLPFYQAALPVFYMYIQITTGYGPFINKTVSTGPNLVNKQNYPEYVHGDELSIIPSHDLGANIGAVIANTQGDTYQAGVMAGIYDLAGKLNWTVTPSQEDGLIGNATTLIQHVKALVDGGVRGLILQSSDPLVLNYTMQLTDRRNISLAVIGTFWENLELQKYNATDSQNTNILTDSITLANSVAQNLALDNFKKPVCFSAHTPWKKSHLCEGIYLAYRSAIGNASDIPSLEDFQHSLNLSTLATMEIDFQEAVDSLQQRGYDPDVYVTLSEHVFSALDYRMLRGLLDNSTNIYSALSQYNQFKAFLEGRVKRVWHYNTYANGFLALLDILLSKTAPHRPWQESGLAVPEVKEICSAGEYYIELSDSPYCELVDYEITSASFRCAPCPPDTFSSEPNQSMCTPCPYGTFSEEMASNCLSCDNEYENTPQVHSQCVTYLKDQAEKRRRIYVGVFVPVGCIIVGAILGFCIWRYLRQRKHGQPKTPSEATWLLSLDELMRPPMQHMSSLPSPNSLPNASPSLSPSATPLLGINQDPTTPSTSPQMDTARTPEFVDAGAALAAPLAPKIQRSMSDVNAPDSEVSSPRRHSISATRDYFTLATVHDSPKLLFYPEKQSKRLIRAIGFHRNLPVFVKQIGFRRVQLNDTVYHEISLMKMARHSKLVEFIGLCIEPQGTFIVEEYCSKGTLYDVLKNPDLDLTWIFRFSLINDLIEGLEFLQRSKFLFHGCLTSQACVITGRWELKLTDYGLYKVRETQLDPVTLTALSKRYPKIYHRVSGIPSGARGTSYIGDYDSPMQIVPHAENLLWLAPESVLPTTFDTWVTYPTKKADIYRQPYQKELREYGEGNYEAVFDRIKNHDLLPDMLTSEQDMYVGQVNEIIIACLRREASARPSIGHVRNQIKIIDPHITGSDNVVDNLALLLEKYANDMENLVRKRTANLQQRTLELEEERTRTQNLLIDLKDAKEVAEAAAASKQNFLANMSHEIRTPMNAVIGMSRILMESNLPAELHDCAETIESSGNHLMAIIDDILDYSKIESGKLSLEHRRMDLIFVFESALKLVAPNYMDKNIILWYTFDPNIATAVYGDVVRLRQILLNLLSNALKFTQEGYVRIHVANYESAPSTPTDTLNSEFDGNNETKGLLSDSNLDQSSGKEFLLISVRDTGIGIPKEKADKLFQTFTQVDASTTRNFGGTGLGLAISRKLSRMMGGDMWFDSEYGQGSTFNFTVKLQRQADSPTYGSFNCFDEISTLCQSAIIVADHKYTQKGWTALLQYIPLPQAHVLSFQDAEEQLKRQGTAHLSLFIVDEEFVVVEALGSEPTTTHATLSALQDRIPSLRSVPTLCVKDMRNQRQERPSGGSDQQLMLPQLSKDAPLREQDSPTPRMEYGNPFESACIERIACITKPVKASKLFATMLRLLKPPLVPEDEKSEKSSAPHGIVTPAATTSTGDTATPGQPRADSLKRIKSGSARTMRRGRSNTMTSTLSSISSGSSGKPLNEIAGNVRSLLVDDNPVNQKVVTRMLSRLGIHPDVAQNGKEACDIVRKSKQGDENPVDLIFMDIWMPEMNGFEASEYIRRNLSETPAHPYIIAMTACVMPGDKEKCLAAGMNGYVSKPIRKDEMEASIHTYTQVVASETSAKESGMNSLMDESASSSLAPAENDKQLPSVTVTMNDNRPDIQGGGKTT
ncbi:hypothetical protein BDB00DRAFT_866325 [Zychaea mexicana]|uniref:uncharacterized protein n=1 Tax=Zychaea mexicana TaxID=64656 RepID=UPI0022FF3C26|nr:uncharacterized protein BDB00DRAFT_866325 [Zychaea mexicana]KAI9499446.1 hypothetical protein BDB00DRAFT_866325 [Zychaea mexicana]